MTLVDFLRARWDEEAEDDRHSLDCYLMGNLAEGWCDCGVRERHQSEVKAHRRTLDLYTAAANRTVAHGAPTNHEVRAGALYDVLQLLALPYASHEDYREEWRV